MAEKTTSVETAPLELISFRIGAQEFCVEITAVREIRGWTLATRLPNSPAYVCGVINLRGTILPVIDLGQRLGLGVAEPGPRHVIIVVNIREKLVGLLVDTVCDIVTTGEETMQQIPALAGDPMETFVSRILTLESRMVGLIALDRIFSNDETLAA